MSKLQNGDKLNVTKDKVIVITGASSGIGRAAAHEFAKRGAKVVAASRNKKALDDVVQECQNLGSEALAVVMDVTKEEDVNRLALTAFEKFGALDVWVNNAAVTLFGRFEEVPTADIRRVVETNLFGYMYGARAALGRFREQGKGTLINISSVVAVKGQPFTGAYVATKAAERALSESLRQELADEENIHVCTVMPAVTDTPIFQHGANYSGKEVVPPRPIHSPESVGKAIVEISENPRREIFSGASGIITPLTKALTPEHMYDKMSKKSIEKHHFRDTATDSSPGNLYGYFMDQLDGGWRREFSEERSQKLLQTGLMLAGLGLAFLAVWGLRRSGLARHKQIDK